MVDDTTDVAERSARRIWQIIADSDSVTFPGGTTHVIPDVNIATARMKIPASPNAQRRIAAAGSKDSQGIEANGRVAAPRRRIECMKTKRSAVRTGCVAIQRTLTDGRIRVGGSVAKDYLSGFS